MIYKLLNGLAPDYLQSKVTDRSEISSYSLRDWEGELAVPLPCTNFLRNIFSYNGAVRWNSPSVKLRQAQILTSFKSGCSGLF